MTTLYSPRQNLIIDLGTIDKRWKGIYAETAYIGDGTNDKHIYIKADIGNINNPALRFNTTLNYWEFSHNGTDWYELGGNASHTHDWSVILNKPISTIHQIDDSVSKTHTHANKAVLDNTTDVFTQELKTKYDLYTTSKQDVSEKGNVDGYASLDSNGKVPFDQLPDMGTSKFFVVGTIADRNDLLDIENGDKAFVMDATADPTVNSGSAEYLYINFAWLKIFETESMDVILNWGNIQNKPVSVVGDIDDAVVRKHSHTNKSVLDNTTESFTTALKVNYDAKEDSSNKGNADGYASLDSNGKVPISQLPDLTTASYFVVENIVERDALTELKNGDKVFVIDATDDLSVTSGSAEYIYSDDVWIKLNETDAILNNKLDKPIVDGEVGQVLTKTADGTAWTTMSGGSIDPGALTYTNETPTPVTIGGIPAGTTFENKTMKEMWDMLLYPYMNPTFTSFNLVGVSSMVEVGYVVGEEKNFTWTTTFHDNIKPNTIMIKDITNNVELINNYANTGSWSVTNSTITKTVSDSHTFTIFAENTEAAQLYRNVVINWRWRIYYGESILETLDEAAIKSLRQNQIANNARGSFAYATGGYKYFVCPVEYTQPITFIDPETTFNVPFEAPYIVTVTNALGITTNYNVYRTVNVLNGSLTISIN